jgi:hypothetical protein
MLCIPKAGGPRRMVQPLAAAARNNKPCGSPRLCGAAGCTSSSALQRVRPMHLNSRAADQVDGANNTMHHKHSQTQSHTDMHTHAHVQQPLGDRRAWGVALCSHARIRHVEAGCNWIPIKCAAPCAVAQQGHTARSGRSGLGSGLDECVKPGPPTAGPRDGDDSMLCIPKAGGPRRMVQPLAAAARNNKPCGSPRLCGAAGCTSSSALQRVRPMHLNSSAADQVGGPAGATWK